MVLLFIIILFEACRFEYLPFWLRVGSASGGVFNDGYKPSDPELKDRHAGWKNPCT